MIRKYKRTLLWGFTFILIFLLSQSHLIFHFTNKPGLLGFPNWLWFMIAVHVLFILALYFFTRKAQND